MSQALIIDPDRFFTAARRFSAFFNELNTVFAERDELLGQIALGLLAREHVLMTGPPGTAKSQVATAVLRRIVDETTGAPSIYSRQFTESTVQTDLVGPLDFKTLMETGRTSHFTDEGILGAVHAFLDEVFDGRDMLLRSALNVLHERELKEGTRTTRGAIECAMMTSNRYLAEVLEGSRETLLAFVDRIAFVSFVPRGFAEPANLAKVLRQQLGTETVPTLTAPLTIQDLDALQQATDSVYVSQDVCDSLAMLLQSITMEMAAAQRADPTFVPTRYFSTRTAVRSGRVLRAICVLDKIVSRPDRPLEVLDEDFKLLRLHLLLSGVTPEHANRLLQRETDPRERRQLEIVRTERDIFNRCIAKMAPIARTPAARGDIKVLRNANDDARKANTPEALVSSARQLAREAQSGSSNSNDAARMLRDTVTALISQAMGAGLSPGLRSNGTPEAVVKDLSQLADQCESVSESMRPLARWLRGRAVWLLEETAVMAPAVASEPDALLSRSGDAQKAAGYAEAHMARMRALWGLRSTLVSKGALVADEGASEERWKRALARLDEELCVLWDGAFRKAVSEALAAVPADQPAAVLARLKPFLAQLDECGSKLEVLGAPPRSFKAHVASGRIWPILAGVVSQITSRDTSVMLRELDKLLDELRHVGLERALEPNELLSSVATGLLRAAAPPPLPTRKRGDPKRKDDGDQDLPTFRRKAEELHVPIVETLLQVSVRLLPVLIEHVVDPAELADKVVETVRSLPPKMRADVIDSELTRLDEIVGYLEQWWDDINGDLPADEMGANDATVVVERLVSSGFMRVMRDEAAAARFALEAARVAEIFPESGERANKIKARAQKLESDATTQLVQLLKRRSDKAWGRMAGSQTEVKVLERA